MKQYSCCLCVCVRISVGNPKGTGSHKEDRVEERNCMMLATKSYRKHLSTLRHPTLSHPTPPYHIPQLILPCLCPSLLSACLCNTRSRFTTCCGRQCHQSSHAALRGLVWRFHAHFHGETVHMIALISHTMHKCRLCIIVKCGVGLCCVVYCSAV